MSMVPWFLRFRDVNGFMVSWFNGFMVSWVSWCQCIRGVNAFVVS